MRNIYLQEILIKQRLFRARCECISFMLNHSPARQQKLISIVPCSTIPAGCNSGSPNQKGITTQNFPLWVFRSLPGSHKRTRMAVGQNKWNMLIYFSVKAEKRGFASWQLLLPLPSKGFDQLHEQRTALDSWRFLCELTSLILTLLFLSCNLRGQRISCCRGSFFVVFVLPVWTWKSLVCVHIWNSCVLLHSLF